MKTAVTVEEVDRTRVITVLSRMEARLDRRTLTDVSLTHRDTSQFEPPTLTVAVMSKPRKSKPVSVSDVDPAQNSIVLRKKVSNNPARRQSRKIKKKNRHPFSCPSVENPH